MRDTAPARGAIASPHSRATAAGARALRAGGNAIDAALAAAATLCVVYPNNVALGSDLVALVRRPDGRLTVVNATGSAGAGVRPAEMRARHGDRLPVRGVDTVTLPGAVRGWDALHRLGAARAWREHFDDAVDAAAHGVPTARSVANAIRDERADLEADPGCRALFLPRGEALAEGAPLAQPALAATLGAIRDGGADVFYTGPVARRWLGGLRALGSALTADDARVWQPETTVPLTRAHEQWRVSTSPPNTQGFALLRALGRVRGLADPLGTDAGRLARVFAASNAVRDAHLADPRFGGPPGDRLIELPEPADGADALDARPAGDTVGISAASSDGWAVSLIQSIYFGFGACVLEPETGILFHNRGTSFSLAPERPHALRPGARPPHTLMPVLVTREGELAWASSTMGGQAQPQIHTHVLLRAFAGSGAVEAVAAARWAIGRQDAGDTALTATVEAGVGQDAVSALAEAGFQIKRVPDADELLGHANLVAAAPDGYEAASDPRSDGAAEVVPT
ncbi:MAG: gamma-glutamyltransferase [Microbacterium sp.]|uniref:gamma-glutamyltransferase n=1 Tax=Microbacterium sp. TaxID=51671 RepID=UPI0039E48902